MVATPADRPVTRPAASTIARGDGIQVPPAVASASMIVDPWHTERGPVIADGSGFTATVVVYLVAGEQPDAPPLLTVNEYVLVTVGVAVGFCAVVEDKLGPLQVYDVAPPAGLAVRFTMPPLQIGPLFVGEAVGLALTVTVVVYLVAGLQPGAPPPLTVNEYVLVIVGVAVGFCAVVEDKLGPLQVYDVAPPEGLAVRFTMPPLQMGPLLVGAAAGVALTVNIKLALLKELVDPQLATLFL